MLQHQSTQPPIDLPHELVSLFQVLVPVLQKLGYKVRPVVAVPAEAFARIELQHQRELMRLQKQVRE